jgi:DNA-binding GntR family transcriptional regulator
VIIDKAAAPQLDTASTRRSLPARVRETIEQHILTGALREGDQIVEYQLARQMGISQTPVREALRTLERDGLVLTRPHRGTFVRRVSRREATERYTLGMELEAFATRLAMPLLTETDYCSLESIIDDMAEAAEAAHATGSAAPSQEDAQQTTFGSADTGAFSDVASAVQAQSAPGGAFARTVELNTAFHRYLVERTGHEQLLKAWLAVNPLNWRFVTYTRLVNPDPVELAERHRSLLTVFRRGDQVLAAAAIRQHVWEVAQRVLPNIPEATEGVSTLSSHSTLISSPLTPTELAAR